MSSIKTLEIKIIEKDDNLLVSIDNDNLQKFDYSTPYWNEYKEDNTITDDKIHLLGKRIFESIFVTDERINNFKTLLSDLKNDENLIISIISNSSKAQEIPYELMFYEDKFILKKPNIHLIRKKDNNNLKIAPSKSIINILYIISLPLEVYRKAPIEPLDELTKIYSALEDEENIKYVNIKILERADFESIRDKITKNSYDIIHFTGHGNRNGLVIEDSNDFHRERILEGEEIKKLFKGLTNTKIVILDACFTASQNEKYFGQSTVSHFEDIPIVIANQSSIGDDFASNEVTLIYKALFEPNLKIFNIMKEVRTNSAIDNFNEWWKPVLYLNIDIRETLFEFSEKNEEKRVIRTLNKHNKDINSKYIYRYEPVRYILEHLRESKYAILHGIGGAGKSYLADYIIEMLKGQFRHLIGINIMEVKNLSDIILEIAEEFADKDIITEAEFEEIKKDMDSPNRAWLKLQDFIKDEIFLVLDNIDIWLERGVFKDKENQKFIEDLIRDFNGKILFTSRSAIFWDEKRENLLDNLIEIETYSKNDFDSLVGLYYYADDEVNVKFLEDNEDNFAKYDYHPLLVSKALQYKSKNLEKLLDNDEDLNEIRDYYLPYFKDNRDLQKVALLDNAISEEFYKFLKLEAVNSKLKIFQKIDSVYNLYGVIKYYVKKSFLDDEVENNLKELLTILEKFETHYPIDDLNLIQIYENFKIKDEKLENTYINLGDLYQGVGNLSETLEYFQKSLKIRKKLLGEYNEWTSIAYNNIGSLYKVKGNLNKALEYFQKSLKIRKKLLGEYNQLTATSYNNIGDVYQDKGALDKALKYYEKSLKIMKEVLVESHPSIATSYNNIGSVYKDKGNLDKALEYYEKSLEIMKKALGENHSSTATNYSNLGLLYKDMGLYSEASECFEKSLKIREKVFNKNHPDVADSYNNIGLLYQVKNDFSKALKYYKKSLKIKEKVLDENHPSTAISYNNLGLLYKDIGLYSEALECFEKSLKIRKKVSGENHSDIADSYDSIGLLYQVKDDLFNSLEYYDKSLKIRERVLGKNHLSTATSYNNIGTLYGNIKIYTEALNYFEKSLKIRKKVLGENHPHTAEIYNNIGHSYQTKGDLDKALEYYEKSLEIMKKALGENNENTASIYNNIAMLYEDMKNIEKALEYDKKAYKVLENTQNYLKYFIFYVYYLKLRNKNKTLEEKEFCEMFRKFEDLIAFYKNGKAITKIIYDIEPIFDKYECNNDMAKKLKPIIETIRKEKNSNN